MKDFASTKFFNLLFYTGITLGILSSLVMLTTIGPILESRITWLIILWFSKALVPTVILLFAWKKLAWSYLAFSLWYSIDASIDYIKIEQLPNGPGEILHLAVIILVSIEYFSRTTKDELLIDQ